MESAGPVTRSRARGGDAGVPSSAAPSTRRKAAPRSSRKPAASKTPPASPKPASHVQDLPVEDADDTAATADIPEQHEEAPASTAEDHLDPSSTTLEPYMPEAGAHGTPAHPGSAAIGGLTPVLAQTTAGTPGATPVAYNPSPVVPIKLDSLWTPQTAQQGSGYDGMSPIVASAGGGAAAGQGPSSSPEPNLDLASMFISTPAAPGTSSPVGGLVAAAAAEPELPPEAEAASAHVQQQSSLLQQQLQQETPSAHDSVLMGSPAPQGVFAFAELATSGGPATDSPAAMPAADPADDSGDTPKPSAPMLSPTTKPRAGATPAAGTPGTPGFGLDSPLPPAETPDFEKASGAAGGTPYAGVVGSPMVTAGSPLPPAEDPGFDDDEPLPPAMSPMLDDDDGPQPAAFSAPVAFGSPPAASPAAAPTAAVNTPVPVQHGSSSTPAPAAPLDAFSTPAVAAAEPEDADMMLVQQEELYDEHELLQEAAAEVDLLAQQLQAVPTDSSGTEHTFEEQEQQEDDHSMESDHSEGGEEVSMEPEAATAEHEIAEDAPAAMELGSGSPAAAAAPATAGFAAATAAVATPKGTPAAAGVTSPGARYYSSSATTAAPPKSALAKPKSGSSTAAPKHAHVVVPDAASPKTAPPAKSGAARKASSATMPGSAAARFGYAQSHNSGSSPGHTPFPSKSKVRAATAAAERGICTSAPAAKGPSHKKEMALAAAHSALKHYSKAAADMTDGDGKVAAAAAVHSPPPPAAARRSSSVSPSPTIPNVSSRLMQPTASSSAKARHSGASEGPDALTWSPPSPTDLAAAAAAAGSPAAAGSRPRLASKIVVPSPPPAAAAEPSMKALKRSIKSKVAEKAQATVKEAKADSMAADTVRSSKLSTSKSSSKVLKASRKAAAAAAEEDLDLDTYEEGDDYDYEVDAGVGEDVDALADSLAGLTVKPVKVAQPRGPLKGVAAPTGRHFRFDDSGNVQETPVSRQRRAPRHTKFDEDGNPLPVQQEAPRWR